MSSEPAISINHISKVYGLGVRGRTESFASILTSRLRHPIRGSGIKRERFRALDDVTFDVAKGEVVGVIGKNGAGKSTLLKILSRITPPTAGHIDMSGSVGSLLEVGTGFHPELTGIENVYLNGAILGMSKRDIDRRLEEIVDFAEVDQFLETPVKRYSSGMRVRLAFAVAAHLDPEILIIDEVLSVGDFNFQAKCLDKMKAIAAEDGRTVLYVSHNLVTVEHLCDRTVLLVDGRLAFDGPTDATVAEYMNRFPHAEHGAGLGVFDLATAERAEADFEMVFTKLVVRPNGGAPSETVRMGEGLQIVVTVEGLNERPGATVVATVGSNSNREMFTFNTRMRRLQTTGPRQSEEEIVIDIPSVLLTPGDYHMDVQVWGADITMIDHVSRAAEFTVVSSDVFGSGYLFGARDGFFVVPWDWELRPSKAGPTPSGFADEPAQELESTEPGAKLFSGSPGNRHE
ncbi:MAG: lipopolysaccharide transport system ATP-binding protein [Acidimicrobiaceae bacterium]|jgi:lipopolysaccharide transport system ATP-binding protein